MGTWNGTCALTNLPIIEGDRVVAYVLNSSMRVGGDAGCGIVDVGAYALPFGLPLRGRYDGYGGVNALDAGRNTQWWKKRLHELATQLMTQEAEPIDDEHLDDVEDFINEGSVVRGDVYFGPASRMRDEDFEPRIQLGLTLMHEEAYERFMAVSLASPDWMFEGDPVAYYGIKLATLSERLRGLEELEEYAASDLDGWSEEKRAALPKEIMRLKRELREAFEPLACFGFYSFEVMASILVAARRDPELYNELARHYVFNLMLGCARKHWSLQCGTGSGNDDVSLQVEMAKYVLESTGSQVG